jgi:hypothetical protein
VATRASADPALPVKGDERHAEALEGRNDGHDLVGLAGVRQREHRILAGDHADVAVARLAGVHEERRRAGARERGGELAADVPDFPMPVTTMRPRQLRQIRQASANSCPKRGSCARRPSISTVKAARPSSMRPASV